MPVCRQLHRDCCTLTAHPARHADAYAGDLHKPLPLQETGFRRDCTGSGTGSTDTGVSHSQRLVVIRMNE